MSTSRGQAAAARNGRRRRRADDRDLRGRRRPARARSPQPTRRRPEDTGRTPSRTPARRPRPWPRRARGPSGAFAASSRSAGTPTARGDEHTARLAYAARAEAAAWRRARRGPIARTWAATSRRQAARPVWPRPAARCEPSPESSTALSRAAAGATGRDARADGRAAPSSDAREHVRASRLSRCRYRRLELAAGDVFGASGERRAAALAEALLARALAISSSVAERR